MIVFLDTSAIYAFLDMDDDGHAAVVTEWQRATEESDLLVSTNYVITEAIALCQNRAGMDMVRHLLASIVPAVHIEWVDTDLHSAALTSLLSANRRDVSFVDCTSFHIMRRLDVNRAFALDDHFREQGFEVAP